MGSYGFHEICDTSNWPIFAALSASTCRRGEERDKYPPATEFKLAQRMEIPSVHVAGVIKRILIH